jgi:hypothetical protein
MGYCAVGLARPLFQQPFKLYEDLVGVAKRYPADNTIKLIVNILIIITVLRGGPPTALSSIKTISCVPPI